VSDNTSISDRLIRIIASNAKLKDTEVTPELNLENSGLDSFARIELVMAIEEAFDIEFSDSESAGISTVNDIIELINTKVEHA